MNDPLRRTLRGLFQIGSAEVVIRFLEAFWLDLTEDQHVALLGLLTLIVTLVQNGLEEADLVPRLIKGPAAPPRDRPPPLP